MDEQGIGKVVVHGAGTYVHDKLQLLDLKAEI